MKLFLVSHSLEFIFLDCGFCYAKLNQILGMEQAAEHGLLLLQQKSQLQRDLAQANERNGKALMENEELRAIEGLEGECDGRPPRHKRH